MKHFSFVGLLALLAFTACTPSSMKDQLPGRWDMYAVLEADEDVTAEHNPAGNRFIEFKADGTFESGGEPYGKNTGRWSIDEDNGILYIDSEIDDDDSDWNITLEGSEMTWTGRGDPRKETFTLIHHRK